MTLVLTLLAGCGGGEPTRSYCESLCDWAVACQATERSVDTAAMSEACLAETRASDASCEKAESGSIDPLSRKTLSGCVSAVDAVAESGECGAFVGSIDEIKLGAPPQECITQGIDAVATFEVARDTTTESGAELCQRFTETYCGRTDECVLAQFDGTVPQAAIDALGDPYEACVARLDPAFTSGCVSDDLYAAEVAFDEVNTARQGARECLAGIGSVGCEDLLAGNLPPYCAASFTSTEQATAFGVAVIELADDYSAYLP